MHISRLMVWLVVSAGPACSSPASVSSSSSFGSSSASSSASGSVSSASSSASGSAAASVSSGSGSVSSSVSSRSGSVSSRTGSVSSSVSSGPTLAAADFDYSDPTDYGDYGDYGPAKPSLSFTIFEDTQARRPEAQQTRLSPCTWAVVNCCNNSDARGSRIACFERQGCKGAWFEDLCTPEVKRGVFRQVFGSIQG
ncbi:dachshund homolog 1-like [Pollicipes pollicipes]|uniref:dachshund homolog 1-like n=1 Tax=Pollicipes pollicipes TaxID=41117 RepID=UPI0018853DCD|nr:dachshund homolog 1-like [Pollicipes pollicipes]XP_037068571.1 dachshund homolog 1-like [Pollicipes pollicipes]